IDEAADELDANADLYAALHEIMFYFGPGTLPNELYEKANLALLKADGGDVEAAKKQIEDAEE
ncbi:MAG: hypothetical protein DSY80_01940, partial [Desulfocapsa sp.]